MSLLQNSFLAGYLEVKLQSELDHLSVVKSDAPESDALQFIRFNCSQYRTRMQMSWMSKDQHPDIESVDVINFNASTNPTDFNICNFNLTYRLRMGPEVFDVLYENPSAPKIR
ncbi:hypothetical protein IM40_00790 [Candidatus Paracaedimonas acanthamoebae]|nr:hypothetical protein IM40_00790 [Candidatus Paracaedimonas acanthamoebae]